MRELNLDGFERSVCVLHGLVAERKNEPIVKERFESIQRRLVPDERPGGGVDHEVRTTLSGASAEGVALPHFETAGERAHLLRVEEVAADGNPAEVHRALVAHDRVKRLERLRRDEPRTGGAVGVRSNHTLHVHGRGELNANLGSAAVGGGCSNFIRGRSVRSTESRSSPRRVRNRVVRESNGRARLPRTHLEDVFGVAALEVGRSVDRDGDAILAVRLLDCARRREELLGPSYASAGQALCFARLRMMVLRAGVGYRPRVLSARAPSSSLAEGKGGSDALAGDAG